MKALLTIILMFMLFHDGIAQTNKGLQIKAVYIATQPVDFGIGQRIDIGFKNNAIQLYESLSYGNWGLYKNNKIKHHFKASLGIMAPFATQSIQATLNHSRFFVTTAINYHWLSEAYVDNELVDPRIFNPWSFELGITGYTWKHFSLGVRTDILRWEPCIDFGYKF